jgi:hypothetical protein
MPHVALLIAASPTPAFYSQVAALNVALCKLPWSTWEPSVHLYLGGSPDPIAYEKWRPYLRDVQINWTSAACFARDGDWAQSDDVFRHPPSHADVLMAVDADTFPVNGLERVLDEVVATQSVAGVIAHYPNVQQQTDATVKDAWTRMATGLIDLPVETPFFHTLVNQDRAREEREAPFYLNFGVVFIAGEVFDRIAGGYLAMRPQLMERMPYPDFSGQVALTLALTAARVRTWELPMRYNFPNDPIAEQMYPGELANVVVFHYLRTTQFDRHRIFASAEEYSKFLALELSGADSSFQQSVKSILGASYPFA